MLVSVYSASEGVGVGVSVNASVRVGMRARVSNSATALVQGNSRLVGIHAAGIADVRDNSTSRPIMRSGQRGMRCCLACAGRQGPAAHGVSGPQGCGFWCIATAVGLGVSFQHWRRFRRPP